MRGGCQAIPIPLVAAIPQLQDGSPAARRRCPTRAGVRKNAGPRPLPSPLPPRPRPGSPPPRPNRPAHTPNPARTCGRPRAPPQLLAVTNGCLLSLPAELAQLSGLRDLDLHKNELAMVPQHLCALTGLTVRARRARVGVATRAPAEHPAGRPRPRAPSGSRRRRGRRNAAQAPGTGAARPRAAGSHACGARLPLLAVAARAVLNTGCARPVPRPRSRLT